MGRRPKEVTPDQIKQVEALAAYLTTEQIADYLGVTKPTFFALMERYEDMRIAYKRGQAKAIGSIAQTLIQQARDGNTTAAIFYLKTRAGWRETNGIELSGVDGQPINQSLKIEFVRHKKDDTDS